MPDKPTISIIMPVHNGGMNFQKCLSGIAKSKTTPKEVIVILDGESDQSLRIANDFDVKIFKNPTPRGPAHARNLGAKNAEGDILFFIDADVVIPEDAVETITSVFQRNPDLSAVFGSYDDEPFEQNFLSQYKNLFHHYVHQASKENASTFWGACGAIRRDIFLNTRGFDENYRHPSIEDIDLGYRIKRSGYVINLIKKLQVKHLKRWGILSLLKADFFYRALPWSRLILMENKFLDELNLKISDRLSVVIVFLLLFALIGMIFMHQVGITAVPLVILLLIMNWNLYYFFKKKRGILFTIKTIPWHWFYFFYSGLAFGIGFFIHHFKQIGAKNPE